MVGTGFFLIARAGGDFISTPAASTDRLDSAAENYRNRDRWLAAARCALTIVGAVGFTLSFRF
jgi:hypothetical protein